MFWEENVNENDYIEWLDLCRKLKNLRCLEIVSKYFIKWVFASFRHIFKCCPTLRFLYLWSMIKSSKDNIDRRLYYFDNVKQEMILIDKNFFGCTAFSRRIDTFLIDWIIGR